MNFLKSIFSESDGTGSSTRVVMGMVVAFVLGIGIAFTTLVFKKTITIEQFDNFLVSGGEFILTVSGPLYGANQIGKILNTKIANSNGANNVNG
jgi:hypothetical protein